MVDLDEFGVRLRRQLQDAGLTYRRAASKTGITTTTVNGWCNGQSPPSYEKLRQFANALSIPVGPLLDESPGAAQPVTQRLGGGPPNGGGAASDGQDRQHPQGPRDAIRGSPPPGGTSLDEEGRQLLRDCAALSTKIADCAPDLMAVLARADTYVRDRRL